MPYRNYCGIDYGSKLAGTTVIAQYYEGEVLLYATAKKQDADAFIMDFVDAERPDFIALDAPLSLPGKLVGIAGCDNYFYREVDRIVKGMSPMFIGGLTARAMQLRDRISDEYGIGCYETYPALWARKWDLKALGYKQQREHLAPVIAAVSERVGFRMPDKIPTWHHVDALLALHTAHRAAHLEHEVIGDEREGAIWH